ncbi:uncharacterized protein isoform X2 [Danio rerio]|uniref:Uncharacterized protein isoform X2 n=1 Tax=Danio rerio TaxID=7955 RepID=A0AC58GUC9_DANRE
MMLHIFLISMLFLEVLPQSLFEQLWLTTSPSTAQNNSNIRYEAQDRSSVQPHYITDAKKRFSLDKKPEITVNYDSPNGEFRVYCEIPGSDNAGYTCFLLIGDENKQILKTYKPSGRTQCVITFKEHYLLNKLMSVKSKVMSCNYSSGTSISSERSPYSNKYNLTAFLPVQVQVTSTTKGSTLCLPQARLSASASVLQETDTVELSCGNTEDLKMDLCVFNKYGQESNSNLSSSCQLSLTASQISVWSGDQSSSVRITCFYTVKNGQYQIQSPQFDPVTVTVQRYIKI